MDPLQQTGTSWVRIGVVRSEEAAYVCTSCDEHGEPLSGAYRYYIHFPPDLSSRLRPFWSITLHAEMNDWPLWPSGARHTITHLDELGYGPDGALTLRIQRESPGTEAERNWLPAPRGRFSLTLRVHSSHREMTGSIWSIPPVQRYAER